MHIHFVAFCVPSTLPLQLNPCLTALGYSLCYGTILMKMIRVWYIFNNPTLHKKIVSDTCCTLPVSFEPHNNFSSQKFRDLHLSLAVLCLVIADVLILGVYLLVEGVKGHLGTNLILSREHPQDIIGVSVLFLLLNSYVNHKT